MGVGVWVYGTCVCVGVCVARGAPTLNLGLDPVVVHEHVVRSGACRELHLMPLTLRVKHIQLKVLLLRREDVVLEEAKRRHGERDQVKRDPAAGFNDEQTENPIQM